jgi:ferritin
MTKQEIIDLLNGDLSNEYKHMHFYLHSSFLIRGLHKAELGNWLCEHAKGEFDHVQQFAKMIVGLGGKPTTTVNPFPSFTNPSEILGYALEMEEEVLRNYVDRQEQARELGGVDGAYIDNFFQEQVLDSRADVDEIRQMIS